MNSKLSTSFAILFSLMISTDASIVAMGYANGQISLIDADNLAVVRNLTGSTGSQVTALKLLNDGRLASGTSNGSIDIWDWLSGTKLATLVGHMDVINALELDNNGSILVSSSADKTVKFWKANNGELIATCIVTNAVKVIKSLVSLGLVSGHVSGLIRPWSESIYIPLAMLTQQHSGDITCLEIYNSSAFLSCSKDQTIVVWSSITRQKITSFNPFNASVNSLKVFVNGTVAIAGQVNYLLIGLLNDFYQFVTLNRLNLNQSYTSSLEIVADDLLAISVANKMLYILNITSNKLILTPTFNSSINCLHYIDSNLTSNYSQVYVSYEVPLSETVFRPELVNNNLIALGLWTPQILIWDLKSQSINNILNGHTGAITCLKLLIEGYLASGSSDRNIQIWNLVSGTVIRTLSSHTDTINSLEQPKIGVLVSCSEDKTIKIWDISTGSLISSTSFTNAAKILKSVDSSVFISGDNVGKFVPWNSNTLANGSTLTTGQIQKINSIDSLGTSYFVSGSDDMTIEIRNINYIGTNYMSSKIGSFSFFNTIVKNVKYISKENMIAAGGLLNYIVFFKFTTPSLLTSQMISYNVIKIPVAVVQDMLITSDNLLLVSMNNSKIGVINATNSIYLTTLNLNSSYQVSCMENLGSNIVSTSSIVPTNPVTSSSNSNIAILAESTNHTFSRMIANQSLLNSQSSAVLVEFKCDNHLICLNTCRKNNKCFACSYERNLKSCLLLSYLYVQETFVYAASSNIYVKY